VTCLHRRNRATRGWPPRDSWGRARLGRRPPPQPVAGDGAVQHRGVRRSDGVLASRTPSKPVKHPWMELLDHDGGFPSERVDGIPVFGVLEVGHHAALPAVGQPEVDAA